MYIFGSWGWEMLYNPNYNYTEFGTLKKYDR